MINKEYDDEEFLFYLKFQYNFSWWYSWFIYEKILNYLTFNIFIENIFGTFFPFVFVLHNNAIT